ncbi:DUF192 domain-containing protein [Sphingomonas sp. AP4-R1]|uniref:DUF192 domain-containing protein n=1 Tax=Sphingomonas sp. AP4-R1 TaxID=2735134 RepID=UPI0014935351|nr:DUF192 domain-containing protein [Sphingomonas sp. AP4-R1]QJU57944.1 DUF192 domain-containing protein [Sphingomonas sp. AP4-R1]
MIRNLRAVGAALLIAPVCAAFVPIAPVVFAPAAAEPAASAQSLRTVPLKIGGQGKVRTFTVEVATTFEQQETGLMYRKTMPADHGMIFPMSPPRPATFWMKNTYLPLDLIFIGPDHRIVRIAENAVPLSLDLIDCPEPAAAVLELNGGAVKAQGIAVGDQVRW